LKLCIGEAFEKEHWRSLFGFLKLKDVTVETLTFGHFIDSIPDMLKKQNDIKELSARAQGEVTLREAIHELRAWCDQSEFNLHDYASQGRTTPLIKEWKELIT
jgi:dynein heavy chain 2